MALPTQDVGGPGALGVFASVARSWAVARRNMPCPMHDVPKPDHWNIGRCCKKNGVKVVGNSRNALSDCCLVVRHTALGRECTHLFYRVSILQCSARCRTAVSRRQTQALTCSPTHPGKQVIPSDPVLKQHSLHGSLWAQLASRPRPWCRLAHIDQGGRHGWHSGGGRARIEMGVISNDGRRGMTVTRMRGWLVSPVLCDLLCCFF